MTTAPLPTMNTLAALLAYDPFTGQLTWRVDKGRAKAGAAAGWLSDQGYIVTRLNGRTLGAHRIIWALMTGRWPSEQVDHINRVRSDNRWGNLREASNRLNVANGAIRSNNTSGLKGVSRSQNMLGWKAKISVDGRGYYLGQYETPEQAHSAYMTAAVYFWGEYATNGKAA